MMAFEEKDIYHLFVYRRTIPYGCCQNLSVELMDLFKISNGSFTFNSSKWSFRFQMRREHLGS